MKLQLMEYVEISLIEADDDPRDPLPPHLSATAFSHQTPGYAIEYDQIDEAEVDDNLPPIKFTTNITD